MSELTRGGLHRRAAWLCACVTTLGLAGSAAPRGVSLAKLEPDVAMTDDTIFVAVPGRGVFQGPVKAGRLSMAQLTPIPALSGIKFPAAIDARGSRLVVLDAAGPSVVDYDTKTGTAKELVQGLPLRGPTGIALAGQGSVAIADPAARAVFVFNEAQSKVPRIDRRLPAPQQLEFDASANALYVYDSERGVLRVEYSGVEDFVQARNEERISSAPLTGVSRILSFVPRRGILYVAEDSGLRVAVLARRTTLTVPQQYYRRRFAAIALTSTLLAGIDEAGVAIEIMPRPMPVTITLDPDAGDPNAGMLAMLDYLSSKRLLAGRGVALERADESYDRVLSRYKLLVPTSSTAPALPPDPRRVQALFCALNPRRCAGGGSAEENDEVVIPQLIVDSVSAVSREKVALSGKSVEQHLDDRVLDPDQRRRITPEYLAQLNATTDNTLESELLRRNLVMAMPMHAALGPGTVIRTDGVTETPLGDMKDRCGVAAERETVPSFLPELITTRELRALPESIRAEAAAVGATEVELAFNKVVRSILESPPRECRPGDSKPGGSREFLLTEVLRVDSLRFRVRPRDPKGAKIAAQKPITTYWKEAPGPFVVAYKAVELVSVAPGLADRPEDPRRLKPGLGGGADILRRAEGEMFLPLTHWRFDALVPVADYASAESPLWELRQAHPAIGRPKSLEPILASARSVGVAVPEDVKEKLIQARKSLTEAISYRDDLAPGTEDTYVAIGEADASVNQDHPGFIHLGRSAWFELSDGSLVRRRLDSNATGGSSGTDDAVVRQASRRDHGTHVAGIVAARPSSLVPGLIPAVRLYLVDTAGTLIQAIQDAYDSDQVRIFNFSFAVEPEPDPAAPTLNVDLEAMKEQLLQHWGEALFIVAAGNSTKNLNKGGSQPFINWVLEAPNILGVGAASPDGKSVLPPHDDAAAPDGKVPGSNFGSRFVHIVAPGKQIYSLAEKHYAVDTGTSMAVPQVTAAAAILAPRMIRGVKAKARLIATSRWSADFDGKVWGGLLDVSRAASHVGQNVVRLQSAKDPVYAITLDEDKKLTVRSATTYPSDGKEGRFISSIQLSMSRILRLEHLGESKFRIISLGADNSLQIMFGRVEGKISCAEMTLYDEAAARFAPLPSNAPNPCSSGGLPVGQVEDYVAKALAIPDRVKF